MMVGNRFLKEDVPIMRSPSFWRAIGVEDIVAGLWPRVIVYPSIRMRLEDGSPLMMYWLIIVVRGAGAAARSGLVGALVAAVKSYLGLKFAGSSIGSTRLVPGSLLMLPLLSVMSLLLLGLLGPSPLLGPEPVSESSCEEGC